MRRLGVILILVLSLTGNIDARAQDKWDAVLDRYEQICSQCKDLRARMMAGEQVSDRSVTSLLGELGRLRNELQQASGSMTESQKGRFEAIRNSYGSTLSEKNPVASKGNPATQAPKRSGTTTNVKVHTKPARIVLDPIAAVAPITVPSIQEPVPEAVAFAPCLLYGADTTTLTTATQQYTTSARFSIIPCFSYDGVPAGGVFAAYNYSGWGGYISARSNFVSGLYSYDCLGNGTIQNGGFFWGNGSSSISEWSVSAGVLKGILPRLELYAGAGYGSSVLRWQDATSAWARVSDASCAGFMLDGGMIFHMGYARLLVGTSWLTASQSYGRCSPSVNIGLGIGF